MVVRFQEPALNSSLVKFSAIMLKNDESQKKSKIKGLGTRPGGHKLGGTCSGKREDAEHYSNSTDSSNFGSTSSSAASKLTKIGQRLRDSCRNLRAKHASGGSNHSPDEYTSIQAPNDSQRSKHYVPMDFSGKEGRIVNYSDLPGNRATKDGYTYFRRKCPSEDAKGLLTDTQANIHLSRPWFHKGVSRDQAQKILATHAVEGLFLVRDSSVSGGFVISYYFSGKTHHAQALPDIADGVVTYSIDDSRTRFFDLLQMVEFYQLNRGILNHRLTHFVINLETATELKYNVKSGKESNKVKIATPPRLAESNPGSDSSLASPGMKPASPKGDGTIEDQSNHKELLEFNAAADAATTVERTSVDDEVPKENEHSHETLEEMDKPKPQSGACNAINNNNEDSFEIKGHNGYKLKEKLLNPGQESKKANWGTIGDYQEKVSSKSHNAANNVDQTDSGSDKEN